MPELPLLTSIGQKLLVILSVSFLHRCEHWRHHLHPLLRSASPPGARCALFWPPAGMELRLGEPATAAGNAAGATTSEPLRVWQYEQQELWWHR